MTAAWLDLLPYMEADGLRELFGERGAFECHRRGVRDVHEPAPWPIVAAVLAELNGDPSDVIEGTSIT